MSPDHRFWVEYPDEDRFKIVVWEHRPVDPPVQWKKFTVQPGELGYESASPGQSHELFRTQGYRCLENVDLTITALNEPSQFVVTNLRTGENWEATKVFDPTVDV